MTVVECLFHKKTTYFKFTLLHKSVLFSMNKIIITYIFLGHRMEGNYPHHIRTMGLLLRVHKCSILSGKSGPFKLLSFSSNLQVQSIYPQILNLWICPTVNTEPSHCPSCPDRPPRWYWNFILVWGNFRALEVPDATYSLSVAQITTQSSFRTGLTICPVLSRCSGF